MRVSKSVREERDEIEVNIGARMPPPPPPPLAQSAVTEQRNFSLHLSSLPLNITQYNVRTGFC